MDIDKLIGHSLADKSAVGAINRPLQSSRGSLSIYIIWAVVRKYESCIVKRFEHMFYFLAAISPHFNLYHKVPGEIVPECLSPQTLCSQR